MTSTASRPLGEPGASATVFSYAQAAKGRTASTTASTTQMSQSNSGTNTPKESGSTVITTSGSVNGAINPEIDGGAATSSEPSLKTTSINLEAESKTTMVATIESAPSSPDFDSSNFHSSKGEELLVDANDSSWDKQIHDETPVDKSVECTERKKGKKGKKDKLAEKEEETEKEEFKEEILVAAPPPPVNFWQQRLEAAKTKYSPQSPENSQFAITDSNLNSNVSSVVKPFDSRRKGKASGAEEFDKTAYSGQNGGLKEQQFSAKSQRKGAEGNFGSKEESNGKRFSPRGSKTSEKEDKSTASQLLPPVEDATSWPTPDTALEEDRRKAQGKPEKEEKDESVHNKPRPKEKWVTVPYIPTVTFSTPIPNRGRARGSGRGRDVGGRGGHASNISVSGEKASHSTTLTSNSGTDARERGRDSTTLGRATSLPPNASKRPVGETSLSAHDQRKPNSSNSEKSKYENSVSSNKAENSKDRRPSIPMQTELSSGTHKDLQQPGPDFARTGKNGSSSEHYHHTKSSGADRRGDGNTRTSDTKEINYHSQTRDRGEGRFERSRGGFRGRGGHSHFTGGQHSFTNGHSQQNGYGTDRHNSGPYSPPLQQGQYSNAFQANPNRGGRSGPRSQSIPTNSTVYTRYPNVSTPTQQVPPLQTTGSVFEYGGMQSLSAIPYNPYIEQYSVLAMVTMQLEYYFSIDNLCKDVYLRKHMDSQGFVFLAFIAKFRRIQSLTSEFDLLRFACQESEIIDIATGEDGIDRIRRQDGWEKWVLAMEERDESAKNSGPERHFRQQIQTRHQPLVPRMIAQHHPIISPTVVPNGTESTNYRAYPTLSGPLNGVEQAGLYITDSPLSAAVPDFAPNPPANEMSELEAETTFTDEEVNNLQLVYNRKSQAESKSKTSSHSSSSRTFSNGSIDGRSISEEILELDRTQPQTLVNGGGSPSDISPDRLNRPRTPPRMSPTKLMFGNAPPVMWVKGQKAQAPITEENKNEPYNTVRARALRHREACPIGEIDNDMKLLYEFWSHFLVRNFNPQMYQEFRKCAVDDYHNRQNTFGMNNLIQYYDEILKSKKKVVPDILARHYVDVVKGEDPTRERIAFTKLRAAWRNGAVEMKSRKKISNLVDNKLREELER